MILRPQLEKEVVLISQDDFLLYEDSLIKIKLSSKPMVKGHVEVYPSRDVKELSELSDEEVVKLFFGASYAASALFELIGAQGTNIILNESDERLCIHVLARFENDGLNFLWSPKKFSPEELSSTAKTVKDKIDFFIWARDHPEEAAKLDKTPSLESSSDEIIKSKSNLETGEESNYLLKSLRRIP